MLERPRTVSGARKQLEAAEHAIGVALMVLRQHMPLFVAFADPQRRSDLLGPLSASEARATAGVVGNSFELARRFVERTDEHQSFVRAAIAKVQEPAR